MDKLLAIAICTFRESVRSKALYVTLFFAAGLVLVGALFGSITVGDQVLVIKDLGLFAVSLFPVCYAVIAGSMLLFKELSKKTVYNILAKPVKRAEFIAGKFFGMLATSTVMLLIMAAGLSAFCALFEHRFDPCMLQAYFYIWLELVIVCAAALFFSSLVVTPLLSGLFTFGVFLAGRSTHYLLYFSNEDGGHVGVTWPLTAFYWILPHLDDLNIANSIVYGRYMELGHSLWAALYALSYAAIALVLAQLIFSRREFN